MFGINFHLPSVFAGAGLATGALGLFWAIIRFLLNRFRKPILTFVAKNGLRTFFRWVDRGCDWFRDHGDKETAKILRSMVQESVKNAPQISKEELYNGD